MNAKFQTIRHTFARFTSRALPALLILMLVFPALPAGMRTAQAILFNCDAAVDVPPSECEALVSFYISTNGVSWTNHANWMSSTTIDDWYGVVVTSGHVEKLLLASNNLTGSLPPEIQGLTYLVDLTVNNNAITGSLPTELGSLANLVYLNLNNNQFSGTIPTQLGDLNNLSFLMLQSNQLSGSIPSDLGDLTSLTRLWAMGNNLSGSIPPELGLLSNLTQLRLSNNQLTGSIPEELANLSSLLYLYLDENQLSGSIPAELGTMSNLWGLYLTDNELAGSIPAALGNLSSLYYLELGNNEFTGSIPVELGNLSNLTTLKLQNNPLTGYIPTSLGELANLDELWLDNTALHGSFPLTFTANTTMFHVSFSDTLICEPALSAFTDWKATVTEFVGTGSACVINPLVDEKLTSSKVTFSWDEVTGASKYKIQLSTKEDFSTFVFSLNTPTPTYAYPTSLVSGKTYYWRVRALVGTAWTYPVAYRFYSMDPLTAPVLTAPPDAQLSYPDLTLEWIPVTNAVRYKLQVARDADFTDFAFNGKVSAAFKDFTALATGRYYWRVKAIEAGGLKSPWSAVRSFTVVKVFPPTLISPENLAQVEPTLVLTWNASGGAVQYKIQVAKDAAFTKLIVSEKVSGTTKELTSLAARSYYWRVKAINAEGFKSTWSQVFKFTVVIP